MNKSVSKHVEIIMDLVSHCLMGTVLIARLIYSDVWKLELRDHRDGGSSSQAAGGVRDLTAASASASMWEDLQLRLNSLVIFAPGIVSD